MSTPVPASPREATRLSEISPQQWKSGLAAWLGWTFDGLELHLYTLVAGPFVALLLGAATTADPAVKEKSAFIQAAFLIGWALGGAFFGRLGDKLGRSRTLALTVLTYALCTGLCAVSQTWWQLMIFRFVAALGIGGEWAVGSSLLAETWPKAWRPWLAAILQTGVNIGILIGVSFVFFLIPNLPPHSERYVFLIGILPALFVFWIRRHVPEPEAWQRAEAGATAKPGVGDLFRGDTASITGRTTLMCALGLSVWWLFTFWHPQHLRQLLKAAGNADTEQTRLLALSFALVIGVSIGGNFLAGWLARRAGNPRAMLICFLGLGGAMAGAYGVKRDFAELAWFWCPLVGFFSGVFGLFTMYLPPLFPTLLRTTGAGFCYNIGRLAAAAATIVFGIYATVTDLRGALLWSSIIAFVAAGAALWLPADGKDNPNTGANS